MARRRFGIEKGLDIYDVNGDLLASILSGTAVPDGVSNGQDTAPLSSLYFRSGTSEIYKKVANAGAAADYEKIGEVSIDELAWRSEKVLFATGEALSAGSLDISAIADNDGGLVYGDVAVNDVIISDVDGSPALFKVDSLDGSPNVTISAYTPALADNNTFVVQKYLPDTPASQEQQAIVHFPLASGAGIKIADINWNLADGITLNGYSDTTGGVVGTDTLQIAVQKIEKGLKDSLAVLGVARNALNLGAFVNYGATFFSATETVKSALQKVADFIRGIRVESFSAVTTVTAVAQVPHANAKAVKFLFECSQDGTPANRVGYEIYAITDGTNVDDDAKKLKLGGNITGLAVNVNVNGANIELQVTSTAAVSGKVRVIEVV